MIEAVVFHLDGGASLVLSSLDGLTTEAVAALASGG